MAGEFEEIQKRRTFVTISYPSAGEMILIKRLLSYGSTINLAGSVKGRKIGKHAVSDWMDIEKERGISVMSSVLQFNCEGSYISTLGTPRHEDFSEDTYRTLMAVDSTVMIIDASKDVRVRIRKLFKVCALRHIPIFTFINKVDRETRDPSALTDEIEELLGIRTCPANWPIGSGKNFKGVFSWNTKRVTILQAVRAGMQEIAAKEIDFSDPVLGSVIGEDYLAQLTEEIELLNGASDEFDMARVPRGDLTSTSFGSAPMNFGIETFPEHFPKMIMPPLPQETKSGEANPMKDPLFSAFVFKIRAGMSKARRDRIAFMRICLGEYQADIEVVYVQGERKVCLNQSTQMMTGEWKVVETAHAGGIIGVSDPGILAVGDTLGNAWEPVASEGIPAFAPEHFVRVCQIDTIKYKQFTKGIEQIAQEGAVQVLQERDIDMEKIIVGAVGVLQFEVLTYCLRVEYNVEARLDTLPYEYIRWIDESETVDVDKIQDTSDTKLIQNLKGEPLLFFTHPWGVRMVEERNPGLRPLEFGKS